MRTQKGGSQANAVLLVRQAQRLGGLWAPPMAYHPVIVPPQGVDAPNSAIIHMICPRLDTRSPLPHPGGFVLAAIRGKWQRSMVVTIKDHTTEALHNTAADWKHLDRNI